MYVIIDKKSRTILHMSNSLPGEEKKPQDLLPGFDPKTMAFGRAPEQYVPARFDIRDGVVVDLDPPPPATAPPAETLVQARERKKNEVTGQALALRAALVPDYQLLNAGLGIYDELRVLGMRATVDAFRGEVNRLEAAIAKAKTVKDVDAIVPNFPTVPVVIKAPPTKPRAK